MEGGKVFSISAVFSRLRIDPYVAAILCAAVGGVAIPARGHVALGLDYGINVAIGMLFFLYGARLSASSALDGVRHWRLHVLILLITFALFPLLGLACKMLVPAVLTPQLHAGLIFLCALPSTVQSSITFTSLARGNVAAAICSASFSNLLGVLLTPLLVGVLISNGPTGISGQSLRDIVLLLLVPFLLGQVSRPWCGEWIRRHGKPLGLLDRGVILLAVYAAFGEGALSGVWSQLSPLRIALLVLVDAALLASVLGVTAVVAGWCGFCREDRIAIVFCGSKKSLASGIPMATVLFAGQSASLIVLPLMLYHQLQLIVCAWLARRFAAEETAPDVKEVAA
jgi:solute carrier family 10 (sodium/bile acid cotransporter), member 7